MTKSEKPRKITITGRGIVYNEGKNQGVQLGAISNASDVTIEDVSQLLRQIRDKVDTARDIDGSTLRKVKEDLTSAQNAVADSHPDANRALVRIKSIAELLGSAATITTSAMTIMPLINKAINWLTNLAK